MNWMDGIFLLVIGISLVKGYGRGLILTFFSLASYVIGWLAAVRTSGMVAERLLATPAVFDRVYQWSYAFAEERSENGRIGHLVEESLQESWKAIPLPEVVGEWLRTPETGNDWIAQAEDWMVGQAAMTMTEWILSFLAFILVFLVVKQLVYLVGLLLHHVFRLPLLNMVNRLGGLTVGMIRGVIVLWILLVLLTPFTVADPEGTIATGLTNSRLLNLFDWTP